MADRPILVPPMWLVGALLTVLPFHAIQAADGPGFDCSRAGTRIEHLLCSDGDPGLPWLDRTLQALYDARRTEPSVDKARLAADQHTWLASRNECHGSDDAIAACMRPLYWQRIHALAAPSDPQHLTGSYRDRGIHGTLRAVQMPNGAVSLDIGSDTGPPAFNSCALTETLVPRDGRLIYDAAAHGDAGDAGCVFTITPAPGHFTVSSAHCPAFCGAGATLDGRYDRIGHESG